MSRKYYSNRYRRYNKNAKKEPNTTFWLRLNISLGIAILAIGIYKMNTDFSRDFTENFKNITQNDISFSEVSDTVDKISDMGKDVSVFAYSDDDSIKLDESTVEYIKNIKDVYVENNTPAEAP